MMKPELKHKPKNNNDNPSPKKQSISSKLVSTPNLPPPTTSVARRNPSSLQPQVLKPNGNRLLPPSSKKLVSLQEEQQEQVTGGRRQQQVVDDVGSSSTTTGKELVVYQNSGSSNNLDRLILPDAQISVDKLLAQWADKIEKAEQEFMLEEMAFERANDRLQSRHRKKTLQALPQQPRTALSLATSAGRMNRYSCPRVSSVRKDAPSKSK
ncbi:hypothetical protein R1flu_014056 [Riccia fluitans]|uniref:Uncharacterized protein n=1 Tax=Riccia fluitans TaxID=41844 RepID=A0ABD1YFC9_9MARC